ncbi:MULTISPECIES: MarR family winged helix-turn-helix transcriptional regulator [Streptomyces]|uniref:DNA-binding MarR family transcriptional regulator n=1 Tax=Streptomyces clavifer TaxID=68188 RepID=A0ABS4VK18_9ACTN|nr:MULTISPECIES: MarR family transcriptional regulator [Streptomyces]KQX78377.1 MarR family transcriptional regulator [Streptomyces sp. Root1319]KQZ03144.1 MarR family transcriptional regulator [Streptomyces sp. Root55]MBP2364275.1 DNA-binding MarR family transcriptional regulator [Streptomyces clavifer]MDX2747211.1 MarR family transcriptional regulator [Streptomyces sp. NRRL_B-2557]MDX3067029.1 MarR family transcriptional regulator [Streptomyces sp. ND04-05B]
MDSADDARDGSRADASAGPGLQALAVELRRMNGEINRLVHSFAHTQGLHATDVQALGAILDADEPLTPGRLRDHLGLSSGAVTACLDRLERAGHIRRSRDSADRRVVHLHYEPTARAAARSFFMPLAEAASGARRASDAQELAAALRFLARMNEELARMQPPGR